MREFNYSQIRNQKWDSELLSLIAAIYKEAGKQEVALALKILARLLVRNDITFFNAVFEKCLDLSVEILFCAGNPGVSVCSSHDSSIR